MRIESTNREVANHMRFDRLALALRMGWGGAVGGFFVGTLLSIVGIALASAIGDKRPIEFEHVFLGGLLASVVGLIWGSVLGLCDCDTASPAASEREMDDPFDAVASGRVRKDP